MKKKLITISGPTASGKTKLSIRLAKKLNCEIISCDSRQFYKEMSIGTAVPSETDLNKIRHHCIQHISLKKIYTVNEFEIEANRIISDQFKTKDFVILVGGSFLYMDSIVKGLDIFPEVSPYVRQNLNKDFENYGINYLKKELKIKDPIYYSKVDINNHRRLIRALEVIISSGKPYSSFIGKVKKKHPYDIINLGIKTNRNELYDKINNRVDQMIKNGLILEAKNLLRYRHLNALNTLGYKEIFLFFDKKISLEECIEQIKKNTRRYAKRQLTWLNSKKNILWVMENSKIDKIFDQIMLK